VAGHRPQAGLTDGIPNFFFPATFPAGKGIRNVTDLVKAFYEETPFPNYDGFDSRQSLASKARRGVFATGAANLTESRPGS